MKHKLSFYEKFVKRLFDIILAAVSLIILSPVFLLTALLVKIKLGSPIIFKQDRPGKDGKIFRLFKFRTMTNARGSDGNLLVDECRLTKFGKILRSTSLDELPELWNIFVGDMSIVGPRPLLVKYLPLYSDEQKRRHDVRPGLTGWAQVNGRNLLDWDERFSLDVWYTENVSFATDVKIIFMTFGYVLSRDGISSESSVTMEEFKGTRKKSNV